MRRLLLVALASFVALPAAAVAPSGSASAPLDLETIMANPDWMGHAVENPYWSVDGRNLYYSMQRDGSSVSDLYRVDPASGSSVKLDPAAM
ncbi:MAG: S9 family peptidase, partial [Rhodanobacter sp.]